MDKEDYLTYLEQEIPKILDDYYLNNYKKQILAWKLNADFKRTYKEDYIWNRILYLTTNSCLLIREQRNIKLAITALKECAEIYEYLSEISENYDKDYLLLLSALCYDLSGYQANAYCLANKIKGYKLDSETQGINLDADNIIIDQIRLVLLKQIPYANYKAISLAEKDLGLSIFIESAIKWYSYILNLKEAESTYDLRKAYHFYLSISNTYLSQLILLLQTRLILFKERSIWENIKKIESIGSNYIWQKYVKLLSQDIYESNYIKDIEKRNSKFEFWISQLRAVEKGLLDSDNNYVIQMPTSAGKTFIAELSILKYLLQFPNKKCIYIAPFRALVSEKESEINRYFSKLGFSVSALTGSYEVDESHDVILKETDVLIATPEKMDLLLRLNPDFFHNVSFIVIDEGHIVGEISSRASLLEFLIIRLRMKIRDLKTLFISAVMPPQNANEYALWLSGDGSNVLRSLLFKDSDINDEWEPTRKLIGSFVWEGKVGRINFLDVVTEDEKTKISQGAFIPAYLREKEYGNKFPSKGNKKETAAGLAYKLSFEGNTLIFCGQPRFTKSVSRSLISLINTLDANNIPDWFRENEDKESFYYSSKWYGEDSYISKAIKLGIGIHFSNMPEQVRNAVESDFKKGKLKVILSTNTIGQGINFPIKNIIFYSTHIGRNREKNIYVENRDFWNIVGRAGRAGNETQGKIIYIINSDNDKLLYEKYTKKENIEEANSLFFKVLYAMIRNHINPDTFKQYIDLLSEPYLLDIITEEIVETEDERIIEQIIDNSLFKIQIDREGIEIDPIKVEFKNILRRFKDQASSAQLKIYGKTGFCFRSCKSIDDFTEQNKSELSVFVQENDYIQILNSFLELIEQNSLIELESRKLGRMNISPTNYFSIMQLWIKGNDIQELKSEWLKINDDVENLNTFLSEALYYLYPWGVTAFLTMLANKLQTTIADFPEGIRYLMSFVKYGLDNPNACLARSLGIKSRYVALFLAHESNSLTGRNFIEWLSNLTIEEIHDWQISKFDKENIYDISLKLTPVSYREIPTSFDFYIKGTYFSKERRDISRTIRVGEILTYERDYKNQYDPYAIRILKDKSELGFVPREYAKIISSEIDLNNMIYRIIVKRVEVLKDYNKILVTMEKVT
jgi:superfamily II DNA/RNA helicase